MMQNSKKNNNIIQIIQNQQQDLLYKNFEHTNLIVGLARWTKFFCYFFIIFQLICVIIELVSPFTVSSPDVFTQLLFLTLLWVTIEILTIPIESISDLSTIDYQKNFISLTKKRFFYGKTKVLASFSTIKAMGVSCAPPAIIPGLFSNSSKRFALIVQTYDDKVINVTGHSLGLDEANGLCETLARRLSGVTTVMGEKDMDLAIAGEARELVAIPCKRSFLTIADAVIMLSLKVIISFATSTLLIFLSIKVIVSLAGMIFGTNLKLCNQPVLQLIFGSEITAKQHEIPFAPASPPAPIELTRKPGLPSIWQRSRESETQNKILINPSSQTIKIATKSEIEHILATSLVEIETQTKTIPEKSTDIPEMQHFQVSTDITPTINKLEKTATQSIQTTNKAVKVIAAPEKSHKDEISMPESTEIITHSSLPATYDLCYAPINSHIPSVDIPLDKISQITKTKDTFSTANIQTKIISSNLPKRNTILQPMNNPRRTCILPGYGIEPIAIIGEKLSETKLNNLICQHSSREGTQSLYENYSIFTDKNDIITIVIVTNNKIKELKTPQNIGINSPIKILNQQYGPFITSKNKPGIHYPRLGISFLPALHNPKLIGAIKIYKPLKEFIGN